MEEIFSKRLQNFERLSNETNQRSKLFSWYRIFTFLIAFIFVIYFLKQDLIPFALLTFLIYVAGFIFLVRRHQQIRYHLQFLNNLIDINNQEIQRLNLELSDFDEGSRYLKEEHPYAYDLDVFGKHSIFQLISRCTSISGKDQLAKDLCRHHKIETILARQKAIEELKHRIDWRQDIQSLGMTNVKTNQEDLEKFFNWLHSNLEIKKLPIYYYLTIFLWIPLILVTSFILLGKINFLWIFTFNIATFALLAPRIKQIRELTNALANIHKQLIAIQKIIHLIEKEPLKSQYLVGLQEKFNSKTQRASEQIKKLTSVVDFLQNRGNPFYLVLNSFFAFDIIFLQMAEKWKEKNKANIEDWLTTLGEFEVIFSYSGFAFSNPEYPFPAITRERVLFETKNIGHPLIHPNHRTTNDFKMNERGAVCLITGSNMAGKSTFLRTIGVNLVLAQCGAPVCANELITYPFQIFTSMRTKDNLMESVSTFYAELIRIKSLLNELNENTTTFYLLDEILKGTNSHDRHAGAVNLIKQLNQSNALGLVSTHDIELNELTNEIKNMENYSFHSEMIDDQLKFDYKLRKGPCTSFNAVELMKKMGISMN